MSRRLMLTTSCYATVPAHRRVIVITHSPVFYKEAITLKIFKMLFVTLICAVYRNIYWRACVADGRSLIYVRIPLDFVKISR